MNNLGTKSNEPLQLADQGRGFSLVEIIVVIALIFTLTSIALVHLQPAIQGMRADSAMAEVKSTLRQARELAISQRRNIVVTFANNNTIQLWQVQVLPGPIQVRAPQPFLSIPLSPPVQFMTFQGEVDTPDGFGIPAIPGGISFAGVNGGPPSGMMFQSDGSFVNGNGTVISGTVYVGFQGTPSSARAITVMGATGRVKAYHGDPNTSWWSE